MALFAHFSSAEHDSTGSIHTQSFALSASDWFSYVTSVWNCVCKRPVFITAASAHLVAFLLKPAHHMQANTKNVLYTHTSATILSLLSNFFPGEYPIRTERGEKGEKEAGLTSLLLGTLPSLFLSQSLSTHRNPVILFYSWEHTPAFLIFGYSPVWKIRGKAQTRDC